MPPFLNWSLVRYRANALRAATDLVLKNLALEPTKHVYHLLVLENLAILDEVFGTCREWGTGRQDSSFSKVIAQPFKAAPDACAYEAAKEKLQAVQETIMLSLAVQQR
jgi:hypothetical protein